MFTVIRDILYFIEDVAFGALVVALGLFFGIGWLAKRFFND